MIFFCATKIYPKIGGVNSFFSGKMFPYVEYHAYPELLGSKTGV
jgi:hypothetical protein